MKNFIVSTIFFALLLPVNNQNGWTEPKIHRVGVLMLVRPDRPQLQGLRDGLREAGYVDSQNLILNMRSLGNPAELRSLAEHFVREKVNVIVTTGNVETNVARGVTREIPIVFMPASDPITAGFVKSFPRPGTNLTGIALIRDPDSYGKQLEVFKEAIPSLGKVTVLYDARSNTSPYMKGLGQLKKVASNLSITIDERPVRDIHGAERAVVSLSKTATDAVFVLCSSLFGSDPEAIIARAIENKLPLFSCGWASQGALVSFALDFYHVGRRGGWYVSQLLKGANPADLPVEVPLKYELTINLKTARAIGLEIPTEVLQRADKVFR
jgi:putative ABC transport system substrate-binding protein